MTTTAGTNQAEKRTDRRTGTRTSPQLQHLPHQDERDDDRGGFVINTDVTASIAERRGKEMREERGDDAVRVRDADAETNEGEHVEAAVHHRVPRPLKERPATPENNRRSQGELDPGAESLDRADAHTSHSDHGQRH